MFLIWCPSPMSTFIFSTCHFRRPSFARHAPIILFSSFQIVFLSTALIMIQKPGIRVLQLVRVTTHCRFRCEVDCGDVNSQQATRQYEVSVCQQFSTESKYRNPVYHSLLCLICATALSAMMTVISKFTLSNGVTDCFWKLSATRVTIGCINSKNWDLNIPPSFFFPYFPLFFPIFSSLYVGKIKKNVKTRFSRVKT